MPIKLTVCQHNEYFVEFLGWYEDQKYIYIAMEYMERGDLAQYLRESGSEAKAQAREIAKQLLEGIMILHARKICHRDLKPQVFFSSQFQINRFLYTKNILEYPHCFYFPDLSQNHRFRSVQTRGRHFSTHNSWNRRL